MIDTPYILDSVLEDRLRVERRKEFTAPDIYAAQVELIRFTQKFADSLTAQGLKDVRENISRYVCFVNTWDVLYEIDLVELNDWDY